MQPLDIVVKGQALESFGFTADKTISGLGLNTFGFLWGCSEIWSPSDESVTTAWVSCSVPSSNIDVCID